MRPKPSSFSSTALSLFAILLAMLFSACGTTVKLTLKTNDNIDHEAEIIVKNGDDTRIIDGGTVSSGKRKEVNVKLKKGESLEVTSKLRSVDGIIYRSGEYPEGNMPTTGTLDFMLQSDVQMLNNEQAKNSLIQSIDEVHEKMSKLPMELDKACEDIMGSLIVVAKTQTGDDSIFHHISARLLGVEEMTMNDIQWQETQLQGNTFISGEALNKVIGSNALLQTMNLESESNEIYQIEWTWEGFGQQLKPESKYKPITRRLMSLDFNNVEKIKNLIELNDARVYYINQVYYLKNAKINLVEGRLIGNETHELAQLVSGNKANVFSNENMKTKILDNQAIFFCGNQYTFNFDKGNVFSSQGQTISYQISYSIYNLNKSERFYPDFFGF